jgi:hypothetical protein
MLLDRREVVGSDTFTRPGMLFSDLGKRRLARRWTFQRLGVKGSQVQILSARPKTMPDLQGCRSGINVSGYGYAGPLGNPPFWRRVSFLARLSGSVDGVRRACLLAT